MSATAVMVTGTLRDDGTVVLDEKPTMPPGRVRLTIEAQTPACRQTGDIMAVLEEIWAAQRARGYQPRSAAEIDAEINALRDESEEEFRETEELQARLRKAR